MRSASPRAGILPGGAGTPRDDIEGRTDGTVEHALDTLSAWNPLAEADREWIARYRRFAAEPGTAHRESSTAQHLTVSAFVLDPGLERIVLCFHGKGRFWLQLGGHIELADASLLDAARREAREESGLEGLLELSPGPIDLDRHELASGFGTCRVHWDVGFAFVAPGDAEPTTSDESDDVGWFPVEDLPDGCVSGLAERIDKVRHSLSELGVDARD